MYGVRDDGLRRKLLQAKDLTLENCVSTCRASEVARVQASSMAEDTRQAKKETDSEIHLVSQRKQWMERGLRKSANVGTDQIRCQFCGSIHKRGPSQWPAYGQRCRYCNHFESQCHQKHDRKRERFVRAVADFEDEDDMMQETNMLSIEESQVDLLESDILMVSAHE